MGMEVKANETPGQLREIVQNVITDQLEIGPVFIDSASREGKGVKRPVKVRLIRMSEK
ncbi:unnamed protein product, partial [Allacma fusca]